VHRRALSPWTTGVRHPDLHQREQAADCDLQGHDPVNGSGSAGARCFVQQPVLQQFEALKT
jgi:alkaline phosphatase D